ncbi:Lon protease [Actinomycetota bacterium]|nr:Lon protease [Actinomycetota bacterium]
MFFIYPSSYIVEKPGTTANVLDKYKDKEIISYTGETSSFDGQILLLTVGVFGGPGGYATSFSLIPALFNNFEDVEPSEVVYRPQMTAQEAQDETAEQMEQSQNTAVLAATNYLRTQGKEVNPDDITVAIDSVGGPSAGISFTLGILQKVGGIDLTDGRIIAATGTIDTEGNIGPIGGAKEKMKSAHEKGARIMLVPSKNYDELVDIPADLKVYKVNTLEDALEVLTSVHAL